MGTNARLIEATGGHSPRSEKLTAAYSVEIKIAATDPEFVNTDRGIFASHNKAESAKR